MKQLTAQEENFSQLVVQGKDHTAAQRASYDCSRMADKSVWVAAWKSANKPKVKQRMAELRAELAKAWLWTRAQSVEVLAEIARSECNESGRVAAIRELNAMHGFNEPDKIEVTGAGGGPLEVTNSLTDLYASMKKASGRKK